MTRLVPWEERVEPRRLMTLFLRALVWVLLFATLYLLRSFFLLIFLTFVFAYIQQTAVRKLGPSIPNRALRSVFAAFCLLGILIAIGAFLVPQVKKQAIHFADRYPEYLRTMDEALVNFSFRYPAFSDLNGGFSPGLENWEPKRSPSAQLFQQSLGIGEPHSDVQGMKDTLDQVRNIGAGLLAISSAFLLSLLFSFLIVLDLPNLAARARGLERTKLAFLYEEMGQTLVDFARVLGRALEAQLIIALLNSVLTGIGLILLGLGEHSAFLLVIVFLCSFIPVAGVFISSVPICLVALQERGVHLMFAAIAMITIVHLIEAYILNPKIYGHHMRMNPVIVLIILTIAGKLFHVWGLVLGVPICTYVFGHAIHYKHSRAEELSAGAAETHELPV